MTTRFCVSLTHAKDNTDKATVAFVVAGCRIGVGVVNQKLDRVEPVEEIVGRARRAVEIFGAERVLLTPDCGFATFADNPIASPSIAEDKLRAIVRAAETLRGG